MNGREYLTMEAAQNHIRELEAKVARLETAYQKAAAFIDVSVCDPDITPAMWKAWNEFLAARAALEAK
jgi:hypothetical protein